MGGVHGPAAGGLNPCPLPVPALTNKLPAGGNSGKPRGGPDGRNIAGDTLATEELAVVMVLVAMVRSGVPTMVDLG